MGVSDLLANCEKEKLHLSGQIQSFGALLIIDTASLAITHASANIDAFIGQDATKLPGNSIEALNWLDESMLSSLGNVPGQRSLNYHQQVNGKSLHVRLIRAEGAVVVELEKDSPTENLPSYSKLEAQLYPDAPGGWQEEDYFIQLLSTLHSILPFHRLMLYRFDSDWVGEVVAEKTRGGNGYMGLKFPASDIPAIARKLYFQNPSRIIPSVDSPASDILSQNGDIPDLTWSDLRSVSPVHAEYLKNMGVGASFSIPLIISDKLWGIVACHNPAPLFLDLQTRNAAEKLVRHFCTVFNSFRSRQRLSLLTNIDNQVDKIVSELNERSGEDSCQYMADILLEMLGASSTALYLNGAWYQAGQALDTALLNRLDRKVQNDLSDYIFQTQNISDEYGDEFSETGIRGVLAIKPNFETHTLRCYAFRLPEAQYTDWAGNPDKSVQQTDSAGVLSPRSSFEKWTQVRGEASRAWTKENQLLAKKVRAVILRQADKFLLSS
ncbi:GAF domain-containing protein [Salinimonas chungwhensis]|uniref:GAF domain-containing protein n=1 Tax=Salinimonas chungwhensis TaxID=265425 RepID=UPI00035D74AB|nr:GAF domain-containing protein [Salinimonas chungwhensis]